LDVDGDGFDDGSTTANQTGDFSFTTTLTHTSANQGENTLRVQATSDTSSVVATRELSIYYAVGSVVEFQSTLGNYAVELLDTDAPQTVANFKSYLASFTDSIVHRSVSDFVIQGGGFLIANDGSISANPERDPVPSEFTGNHSNVRGTIAMALFGTDADSGTNQWFINVADNSGLDASNFTVFGQVIGSGMSVVDAINALPGINLEVQTGEGALGEVPILGNLAFETIDGTVSINQGSRVLTGTGTTFLSDLVDSVGGAPGSAIRVGDEVFTISSILSNTSALVNVAATATQTNATIERHATPSKASYVVFSSIGEILNAGT
jgi:cyclophilin family peptidyl-prolyl cis-trans isomerase